MVSTRGQSPEPVGCPRGGLRGTLGDESALAPPAAAERVSSPHQNQRPGCCSLAYLLQALSSSEQLPRSPPLPPPRPQSGRSVGEKVGEQAAWQWGWVQHHESRTAPGNHWSRPSSRRADPGAATCLVAAPGTISAGARRRGDLRSPPFLAAAGAGQMRPGLSPCGQD